MNRNKISAILILFFAFTALISIQAFANQEASKIVEEAQQSVVIIASLEEKGVGSGVIIDPTGYIVTNSHVADAALLPEIYGQKLLIVLENKRKLIGEVISNDPKADLAVIKADPQYSDFYKSHFMKFGDSDLLRVGQEVFAIGHPLGFGYTITRGIISNKERIAGFISQGNSNYPDLSYIQTDAAINPGNSGGALIDERGNLIGINTLTIPFANDLGFAISSNEAKQFFNDTLNGTVKNFHQKPVIWVGIVIKNISYEDYLKQTNNNISLNSLYIEEVLPKRPAEKTGLKKGDIIFKVDGKELMDVYEFYKYLQSHSPGETITLDIVRNNKQLQMKISLEIRPKEVIKKIEPEQNIPQESKVWIGMDFDVLANELKLLEKLHQINPLVQAQHFVVLEIKPNSPAEKADLQKEDVIIGYDSHKPQGTEKFMDYLAKKQNGDKIVLTILRGMETKIITVTLEKKPKPTE